MLSHRSMIAAARGSVAARRWRRLDRQRVLGRRQAGKSGEYVDYASSKGAIDTMTVGLAREIASEGVRVNAVRPGLVDTSIHASGGQPDRLERLAGDEPDGDRRDRPMTQVRRDTFNGVRVRKEADGKRATIS
jgi:NAD(P)-dependent dehydrogenase (short-subunit alcohol dehydrogenase family)